MTQLESINARGLARGWHAEQLQAKAASMGVTMATAFLASLGNTSAFNVPAEAVKCTPQWITYRFIDGSETRFRNREARARP